MSKEKQNNELVQMYRDLGEIFDEEYEKRRLITPQNTAEKMNEKGYRKQSEGEWKQTIEPLGAHDVDCVECSACGESWVLDEDFDYDVVKDFWNFCPNCGAKMKGGAE